MKYKNPEPDRWWRKYIPILGREGGKGFLGLHLGIYVARRRRNV